ncbi:unnamed protein product [Caretta caretta]
MQLFTTASLTTFALVYYIIAPIPFTRGYPWELVQWVEDMIMLLSLRWTCFYRDWATLLQSEMRHGEYGLDPPSQQLMSPSRVTTGAKVDSSFSRALARGQAYSREVPDPWRGGLRRGRGKRLGDGQNPH